MIILFKKRLEDERTRYLESQSYPVVSRGDDIRFWNGQVEKNIEDVVRVIEVALNDK